MRKFSLLFTVILLCLQVWAQNRTITGRVVGPSGSPVPDVSVQIKGTNIGTVTDAQGRYSLRVPANARTLVFSAINAATQEQTIDSDATTVNVTLASSETSLQEVVVVGYGTQRRREITGNVATVKGAEVAQKPVQSFEQALGGRAAGVQITVPNGVLNNPPVFRIRGTNSISLSSYPLIVIDGVPTFTGDYSSVNAPANPLASLNPNDIESIDIAKDAAATAIYGSRAANGVVFITTKKGRQGKTKINYDGWVGWSQPFRLPEMLDAFQYTSHKNEALRNANLYDDSNPVVGSRRYFALMNGPDGEPVNTNWNDYAYRTGVSHNHAISLSGANETTSYYFGAGYTDQEGMIRHNDFTRKNVLFNVDSRLNKILTVGGKISFSNEMNRAASSTGSLSGEAFSVAGLGRNVLVASPNVSPYNNDGSYNIGSQYIGVGGNVGIPQVGFFNIVPILDLNRSNSENNHTQANAFLQLKPLEWITLRTLYGIDNINIDNDLFWNPLHGDGQSYGGYATASYGKYKTWLWSNTAQFDRVLLEDHTLSLLVGNEQQRRTAEAFGINRQTLSDPAFDLVQAGWNTNNATGMEYGENYLLSSFGRLNYDLAKKYFLSGNIRQDEYSGLGKKKGVFWGVSAGWDIAREDFWEGAGLGNIFNAFRLRGSYGKVGNIGGVGDYEAYSTYGTSLYGGDPTLGLNPAASIGSIGNPELTWETSIKTDIGLTFGLLNDRISGEVAYFKNDIDNLILNVRQSPSTGLSTIASNVGTMYNKGVELTLNATPVRGKAFSWSTSFNLTSIKNEVTSLAPGLNEITYSTSGNELTNKTLVGYPMGYLFVVRTGGVDPASGRRIFYNNEGDAVLYQNYIAPGSGGFNWTNSDGTQHRPISQSADGVLYGNTLPKSYGGWDNTFRYKGFELNALLTYQTGFYIYYGTHAGLLDQRYWNNTTEVLNRWQKPGDITNIPKVYYGDNVSNGSSMPISNNVFKGDFLKLRNLTLGYTLPDNVSSRLGMANARFYVSGQNLAILTDYPGPDPETSANGGANSGQGVDRNQVGNARTLTVGLNLTF